MSIRGRSYWDFSNLTIAVAAAFAIGVLAFARPLIAQDLLGAGQALRRITESLEQQDENHGSDATEAANPVPLLLKEFQRDKAGLSAEKAAQRWLQIYGAWCDSASVGSDRFGYSRVDHGFAGLISALPEPDHWDELSKQITARQMPAERVAKVREHTLRMLGYRLTAQSEQLQAELAQARKLLSDDGAKDNSGGGGVLGMLGQTLSFGSETNDWQIQSMNEALSGLTMQYAPEARLESFERSLENFSPEAGYFAIPNLIKIAGEERSRELLWKALLLENASFYFEDAGKTEELARTVARGMLDEIRHPQWQLCETLECIEMYEAFAKLDVAEPSDYEVFSAGTWYVSALIIAGRGDDVVSFIEQHVASGGSSSGMSFIDSLEYRLIDLLEVSEYSDTVYQFLFDALQRSPELPLWSTFAAVAARKGKIDQMLEIVQSQLDIDGLSASARRRMQKIRGDTLLAADRADEGAEQYRQLIDQQPSQDDQDASEADERFSIAIRIAEVGRLLDRPEWIQTGVKAATQLLREDAKLELDSEEFATVLIRLQRFVDTEQLLVDRIARQLVFEASAPERDSYYSYASYGNSDSVSGLLTSLLRVYHVAGRHEDVLNLLSDAPWWGSDDLSGLVNESSVYSQFHDRTEQSVPIGFIAATALAEVGRGDEAKAICESLLLRNSGHDPTWSLLLKLSDDFESFANKVFAQDRFEERPLIWLARFHIDQGNTAKADALIRRAIKIDPSDGEQGRQNRMRAYAILAEVLQRQGDVEKAEVYRGVLRAIRMAEDGDQFYRAGLLTRGIKMYESSLTHFEDAYCIQSRLAVQFAANGEYESAAKHYQKAFELMPSSFGRVESHCFGCEEVFTGKLAGDIAERVFTQLITASPENPQLQYLMGYLNAERERSEIAIDYFQEAARLDPDYFNAWKKILESDQAGGLATELRDQAVFNLIRLDPLARHTRPDITQVGDLKQLWTVLAAKPKEPELGKLLPLAASAAKLESEKASAQTEGMRVYQQEMQYYDSVHDFASHGEITAIANLVDLASQN